MSPSVLDPHGRLSLESSTWLTSTRVMGKFDIPILPVTSVTTVPATLTAFQRQLGCTPESQGRPNLPAPAKCLLPFCTTGAPLSSHAVNVLTDITEGFPDLAQKVATADGQQLIKDYLGEDAGGGVISFLHQEYMVN